MWIHAFGIVIQEKIGSKALVEIDDINDKTKVLDALVTAWGLTGWYLNMDVLRSISNNLIIVGTEQEKKQVYAKSSIKEYEEKQIKHKQKNKPNNNGQLTMDFG